MPTILEAPPGPWVDRLRRDHLVWLVKEQSFARVDWAWEPPEPGHIAGRMAFSKLPNYPNGPPCPLGTWFVRDDGAGLDNKQLILPVEGYLPEIATPISEPVIRQIHRELDRINSRLDRIWRTLDHARLLEFERVMRIAFPENDDR